MLYDFTILKERFRRSGWTLQEWSARTRLIVDGKPRKVHFASIHRCLKSNKAHQSTAKALIKPFGMTYEMILPKEQKAS